MIKEKNGHVEQKILEKLALKYTNFQISQLLSAQNIYFLPNLYLNIHLWTSACELQTQNKSQGDIYLLNVRDS